MQERAIKSRQRIFKVACELFAHHGYAATPIGEIVRKAKINRPTLYYYFGSKAGLYHAVVDAAFDERMQLMKNAAEKYQHVKDRLTAVLEAMLQFAHRRRDFVRICFAMAFAAPGEIPANLRKYEKGKQAFDFVHELVKEGLQAGELDSNYNSLQLATAIYAQFLIYAMAVLFEGKGPRPPRPVGKQIVDLFLLGAKKK